MRCLQQITKLAEALPGVNGKDKHQPCVGGPVAANDKIFTKDFVPRQSLKAARDRARALEGTAQFSIINHV